MPGGSAAQTPQSYRKRKLRGCGPYLRSELNGGAVVAGLRFCADIKSSARIVDCARTKGRPYAIDDLV
jgi:hypothetical protein